MSRLDVAPASWGILADDLTGAADAGAVIARAGTPVRVHLSPVPDPEQRVTPGGVDIVVTEARHLDDSSAAEVSATATAAVLASGASRAYLKIDSVGRGSVAAQVRGALQAWRDVRSEGRALVCPAYPALGRTVAGGVILVDGVRSTSSPAADDPVAPPATADLHALFRGGGIDIADAVDIAELAWVARRAVETPQILPVGSAGLLAEIIVAAGHQDALVSARGALGEGRVVIGCSSRHPIALRQLASVDGAHDIHIVTPPAARLHATEAAAAFAGGVVEALSADVVALVLVGGDGALAALRRMGVTSLDLDASPIDGCAVGVAVGGIFDGLTVATKSGGFGDASTLLDLLAFLRGSADAVHTHASMNRRTKEQP